MRKILMSASALALVMAMSAPALAGTQANNGINCAPLGGAPGLGANFLSAESQGGDNPHQPGIGNLSKSFGGSGVVFQSRPFLLKTFCVVQNGNGKGPGGVEPPPAD